MHTREEKIEAFGRFLDTLDTLREKCPWDRKQTNESLRPNTIEETYELCEALMNNDQKNICKELGDVLLHIGFYARIGEEKEEFDIADVCNKLTDKLIFRHPHVYHPSQVGAPHPRPLPYGTENDGKTDEYGTEQFSTAKTSGEVKQNWEQIKQKEKDGNKSVLSGVPTALPALIKAYRIQEKARNVGFDWQDRGDVWAKVHEEIDELRAELENDSDKDSKNGELGDVLFSIVNAARLYKLNPDTALEMTNRKFTSRFNYIEEQCKLRGEKQLKDMTLEELDALWNEAKERENNKNI